MKKKFILPAFFLTIAAAAQQQPASDSQPRPPAKGPSRVGNGPAQHPSPPIMFRSSKEIEEMIARDEANVAAGKQTDGTPLVMQGPFRATMEWRNTSQKSVNVHETDAELFVVLKGHGTLVLGGTLVNPRRAHTFAWEGPTTTADQVEGATDYPVSQGDMIMIPPGTPHTVRGVDSEFVLWSMHLPLPAGTPATDLTPMPVQPKPAGETGGSAPAAKSPQ